MAWDLANHMGHGFVLKGWNSGGQRYVGIAKVLKTRIKDKVIWLLRQHSKVYAI